MLLTGDLEKSGEDWLVEQARPAVEQPQPAAQNPLRCTILDAGHHGASNATGEALLDLAQPELVLISCGKNNRYGHPAPETLKRLEERGIRWYSTAEVGAIQVQVGKKKVKINNTYRTENTKKRLYDKREKNLRKSKTNHKTNRIARLNEQ